MYGILLPDLLKSNVSALSKHPKEVHKPPAGTCGTCNATFASVTLLNEHSNSAYGLYNVRDVCGKIFKWRSSLISHTKSEHNV